MAIAKSFDFLIQWHLTERCNLRCSHCYQTAPQPRAELSIKQMRGVVAEVSQTLRAWSTEYGLDFSPSFNITGGEPLLFDGLDYILNTVSGRGFEVYLLTNGTLVSKGRALELSRVGVKGVQVSIEGPEDIHDGIRGRGSFRASVMGVKNFLDAGLKVTLNSTLSQINAGRFAETIGLASELGVQRLGFSRLVPSGRGAAMLGQSLDKAALEPLYRSIFAAKVDGLELVTGDPLATHLSDDGLPEEATDRGDVPLGGCSAGVSGITILADGTMVPCRRLPVSLGNILSDSLREVWAASDVLRRLRDRKSYTGKCAACPRWASCRGCRAIAYAYAAGGGDGLTDEDPHCFIT